MKGAYECGMKKIKVAICDDAVYVCKGYEMSINSSDDMECVGTAYDSHSCLEMVERVKPDVLLLDIQIEDEKSGIDLITQVKDIFPKLKVIMLTSYCNDEYIFLSLLKGADAYVVKSIDGDEIKEKIREEYNKELNSGSETVIEAFKRETRSLYNSHASLLYILDNIVKLAPKEYQTLKEIYMGYSYKEIAERNVVEEVTVRTCVSKILKKLNYKSMNNLIEDFKKLKIFEFMGNDNG